jgi:glycine/D-amino acid oxidase-like deaminating enzyme
MNKFEIAFIGGGVQAAAPALFLTQHGDEIGISVFERDRHGGEATFSNHGRVHGSGSSLLFDPPEVSRRKADGLAMTGALPGVLDTTARAVYAFECGAEAERFIAKGALAGIPVDRIDPDDALRAHFGPTVCGYGEMVEHAANFGRLRNSMLACAAANGAKLRFGETVTRIERLESGRLRLFEGRRWLGDFDLVVNMAGRFAATVDVDGRPPLAPKQQARWPVFIVDLAKLAGPNRVLTVIDRDRWIPSRIPHAPEGVVTFDCKPPLMEVSDDPFALKPLGPRLYDPANRQERLMMEKITSVFPALHGVDPGDIGVFYGVHGRSFASAENPHHTPSDILTIERHADLEGYLEPSGGLATSAVRDAFEIVEAIAAEMDLRRYTPVERLMWAMTGGFPCGGRPTDPSRWELPIAS